MFKPKSRQMIKITFEQVPLQERVSDVHVDSVSSDQVKSAEGGSVCCLRWEQKQYITLVEMVSTPACMEKWTDC